jgi:ABC-type polar amino acid transport system ATPase subunit
MFPNVHSEQPPPAARAGLLSAAIHANNELTDLTYHNAPLDVMRGLALNIMTVLVASHEMTFARSIESCPVR